MLEGRSLSAIVDRAKHCAVESISLLKLLGVSGTKRSASDPNRSASDPKLGKSGLNDVQVAHIDL